MLETIISTVGLAFIFGPLAAFALCKKTAEHAKDPPDFIGGVLTAFNIVYLGISVTLYLGLLQVFPSWFAGTVQAAAILIIQYFLWRRALRNTRCGERLIAAVAPFRSR